MAKKRVTVYMQDEDIEWLANYPVAGTIGGSAVFLMEWAVKMVRGGMTTVLKKLDKKEKRAIIDCVAHLRVTHDYTPMMLEAALSDWFNNYAGMAFIGWSGGDEMSKLREKCRDMTPAEVIGLLSWAKGEGLQGDKEADEILAREEEEAEARSKKQ